MVNILLSAANSNLSPIYGTRVLKFFSKLFQQSKLTFVIVIRILKCSVTWFIFKIHRISEQIIFNIYNHCVVDSQKINTQFFI